MVWGNSVSAAAVDADAEAAGDPADTALDVLMMAVGLVACSLPWLLGSIASIAG